MARYIINIKCVSTTIVTVYQYHCLEPEPESQAYPSSAKRVNTVDNIHIQDSSLPITHVRGER